MKSQPRPRSLFRIIFGRTTFVILGLLLQIAFFFSIFRWLGNYIHFVYITYVLVSSSVVIAILNRPMDSSFKMAWIIPVLLIPISALSYMCLCRSSSRQGRWQDGSICLLKKQNLILSRTHRCRSGCGQPVCVEAVW